MERFWLGSFLALTSMAVCAAPMEITKAVTPMNWQALDARVSVELNTDLLKNIGLRIGADSSSAEKLQSGNVLSLQFGAGELNYLTEGASFARFSAFSAGTNQVLTVAHAERSLRLQGLRLRPDLSKPRALVLSDAKGKVWFVTDTGQVYVSGDGKKLAVTYADFAVGPALASWLGNPRAADLAIGNFVLGATVKNPALLTRNSAECTMPKWHGLPIDPKQPDGPKYETDVFLANVKGFQMQRCDFCDGPGGAEATVVMAPDAVVRNTDLDTTADVPWHNKFGGQFPPYSNDQHPMLVWNLYRIHQQTGELQQIGRSAAKHAFATINDGCVAYDCGDSQVLYRTCIDEYPSGTNDIREFLAPRSEIVPARGIWARCGSLRDADCNGIDDSPQFQNMSQRLTVPESAIAESETYRYFYEAWYLVRDDINVFNSMGHREFTPEWIANAWREGAVGAFTSGPVIDSWVNPAAPSANARSTVLQLPDGKVKLAVRVEMLPSGSYRYTYALMNVDYVKALVQVENNNPPDVRMLSRSAISGFVVPTGNGVVTAAYFSDGDANLADWSVSLAGGQVRYQASGLANELTWGVLNSFIIECDSPPMLGSASINTATGFQMINTLIPNSNDAIFGNGFE